MQGGNTSINLTTNVSANSQDDYFVILRRIVALAICYCMCLWTISIHGLLILCFYLNRKAAWVQQAKGMLPLTVTDFLSGVGFFLLISVQSFSSVHLYMCILPLGSYMATQLLTSLQILRLCIYRLTVVLKNTKQLPESTRSVVVQFVILSIVSIAVASTAFSWIKLKDYYTVCTLKGLAEENMRKGCIFMLLLFTVPNFVTTCIYIYIMCLLKSKSGGVQPVTQLPTESVTGGDSFPSIVMAEQGGRPKLNENSTSAKKTENASFNFAMRKYWQKAVVTIGLILLLNNISELPYISVISYQIAYGVAEGVPGYLWLGSGFFIQLNSALSPFVYVLRVKAINFAFRKMVRKLCCWYKHINL